MASVEGSQASFPKGSHVLIFSKSLDCWKPGEVVEAVHLDLVTVEFSDSSGRRFRKHVTPNSKQITQDPAWKEGPMRRRRVKMPLNHKPSQAYSLGFFAVPEFAPFVPIRHTDCTVLIRGGYINHRYVTV